MRSIQLAKAKSYAWKDPKGITNAALVILAIDLLWVVLGLSIQLVWGRRPTFQNMPPAEWAAPQWVEWTHAIFGLVTLSAGVVLIFWILRASKNAHVLKRRPLTNSPIFAALWWYVIPFMSLFMPLESMGEIWDASAIDAGRRKQHRAILMVWWIATLLAGALGFLVSLLRQQPIVMGLQSVTSIVQCLAFAYIVRQISSMQVESHQAWVFSDAEPTLSVLERVTG